jgi:hypothetical protein
VPGRFGFAVQTGAAKNPMARANSINPPNGKIAMFTGLVIRSILRPAVLPSHGVQILPAQTAINKADDVSQHDRTPLFDRHSSERILVSGGLRRFQKMVSSDIPVYPARSRAALTIRAAAGTLTFTRRISHGRPALRFVGGTTMGNELVRPIDEASAKAIQSSCLVCEFLVTKKCGGLQAR